MNIFRKAFHRTFNAVMYALIPFFPYREPELIGDLDGIVEVLKANSFDKVMIVTDKGIRNLGLTAPLESVIKNSGMVCTVYDNTMPNPTNDNVEEARELYISSGSQAIIAFGGGSAMDCAKAVGARIVKPKMPLEKMQGLIKIRRRLPLLIAVPTTAGTGSETTVASVIVDAKTHHKYVINDFCLIPRYVLLDPQVTVGLPKGLTATTGMDALTHAVEVYVGKSRTKATKAASEQAVKLIFENLEVAYENGTNIEARKNMLHASYLAGTAFTKSYVGYVHAVAHTLGGKYGLAHGFANAVLLPVVLRAYGDGVTKALAELAIKVGLVDKSASAKDASEAILSHIEGMNERMQIPSKFNCIKKDDIPEMARLADKEANPLYPVPVLWNAKELELLYHLVCDEKPAE